jgi:hypothetical protein
MQRCVKIAKQSVQNFRRFKICTTEQLHFCTNGQLHFYIYRCINYKHVVKLCSCLCRTAHAILCK